MSQGSYQARAYPSFCSMKWLEVFLFLLGWYAGPLQCYPKIKLADSNLYYWVEEGTVRVKCLAQEHNTKSLVRANLVPRISHLTASLALGGKMRDPGNEVGSGLQPRLLNPKTSTLNHEATAPPTILRTIKPAKCNVASLEITIHAEFLLRWNCFIQL